MKITTSHTWAGALVAMIAIVATSVAAGPATAATTDTSCAATASGWTAYGVNASAKPGDLVPAHGIDPLWDRAVDGVANEGLSLQLFADEFAGGDIDLLYVVKSLQWASVDRNGNGLICVKEGPSTTPKGFPDFAAIFHDDKTAARS